MSTLFAGCQRQLLIRKSFLQYDGYIPGFLPVAGASC